MSKRVVAGEPIGWIVLRRRGGWNEEPEVVGFEESECAAMIAACTPEVGGYDPPADVTDVFTYHAVMPCPLVMTVPCEVRSWSGSSRCRRPSSA